MRGTAGRTLRQVGSGVVLVFAALLLFAGAAQAKTKSYTVTDVGTLGGQNSEASAINNNGQIAGTAETGAVSQGGRGDPIVLAFRWSANDMTALPGIPDVDQ